MQQITFKGNPIQLEGNQCQIGQQIPNDICLLDSTLKETTIQQFKGQTCILNIVPSLDTPVCATQSRKFYAELQNKPVKLITISCDLPFAQARFCGTENLNNMITLSDHKNCDFGRACGLLIPSLRLLTRAVIVIDANQNIKYQEICAEVTSEPNYDAALKCIEQCIAACV